MDCYLDNPERLCPLPKTSIFEFCFRARGDFRVSRTDQGRAKWATLKAICLPHLGDTSVVTQEDDDGKICTEVTNMMDECGAPFTCELRG